MKKFIVSLVAATLAGISMSAQNPVVNNPENKGYFGLRLSADITCPGKVTADNIGLSAFKNGGGIEFGGIYNIPVAANFYIEPGVKLFYDSYSLKKEWLEVIQDDIILNSASINKFGIRIPVMFGYHFDFTKDFKLSIFTGPELEMGITSKEHIKGHNIDISESQYGKDGDMNRVNFLWCFGAGITYQHVYFGITGGVGLSNMLKDSYSKFHESRVTIGLGYNF